MLERAHIGGKILTAIVALLFCAVFTLPSVPMIVGQRLTTSEQGAVNTAAISNLDERQKDIVARMESQDREIIALRMEVESGRTWLKALGGILLVLSSFTAITGLKLGVRRERG